MLSTAAVTCAGGGRPARPSPRLTVAIILVSAVGRLGDLFRRRSPVRPSRACVDAAPRRIDSVALTISAADLRLLGRRPCGPARRAGVAFCEAFRMSRAAVPCCATALRDLLRDLAHLRRRLRDARRRRRLFRGRGRDQPRLFGRGRRDGRHDRLARRLLLVGRARDLRHDAGDLAEAAENLLQSAGAGLGQRVALVGDAHALVRRGDRFLGHFLQRLDDRRRYRPSPWPSDRRDCGSPRRRPRTRGRRRRRAPPRSTRSATAGWCARRSG